MSQIMMLVEGMTTPAGHRTVTIPKGPAAGRYAVLPRPECEVCHGAGAMTIKPPGAPPALVDCNCVTRQLQRFLHRGQHIDLMPALPRRREREKPAGDAGAGDAFLVREVARLEAVVAERERGLFRLAGERAQLEQRAAALADQVDEIVDEAKDGIAEAEALATEYYTEAAAELEGAAAESGKRTCQACYLAGWKKGER